ncbi:MAG: hypothetical protein C5B49_09510 [Bdellovibrio sp.]|nr:MAG: hypothetical protein C5B49_09510 [Bdellovibrio sp.]
MRKLTVRRASSILGTSLGLFLVMVSSQNCSNANFSQDPNSSAGTEQGTGTGTGTVTGTGGGNGTGQIGGNGNNGTGTGSGFIGGNGNGGTVVIAGNTVPVGTGIVGSNPGSGVLIPVDSQGNPLATGSSSVTGAPPTTGTGNVGTGGTTGTGNVGTGGTTGTGTSALPPTTTTGGGNTACHNFVSVALPLKILIMLDDSGSTIDTDPQRQFRSAVINGMLQNYSSKTNFSWNLSFFQNDTAQTLIPLNSPQNPVFSDAATMSAAVNTWNTSTLDGGDTPYALALNLIDKAIVTDPGFSDPNVNYAIVLISDGMPNPALDDVVLTTAVNTLVNLKQTHITFSTVFFNNCLNNTTNPGSLGTIGNCGSPTDDRAAIARLQAMAQVGGGQFANTIAEGSNINLANVLTVPPAVCK